jgi:hypothetical protein
MVAPGPYREATPVARESAAPGITVCRRCGVVAPTRASECDVCRGALAETRAQVPAQRADLVWVAVRCSFTCNSCRFQAPLDGLDADGAVECAHCGLRQRFEVNAWTAALEHAHAVGDLAGPWPEGRSPHPALWIGAENPYSHVGTTTTFVSLSGVSGSALQIDAAPGHPVCRKCAVPLVATVTAPGVVATSCPGCGEQAAYGVPNEARALCPTLVAAVSDDHRTDRPRARQAPTPAGAVALSCPSCGGPLSVQGSDRLQTCSFCKASCIIPLRVFSQARNETPAPEIWWVLLAGVSTKRGVLEAPTVETTGGAKKAVSLLKPSHGPTTIGSEPGVYEAPEPPGVNWPQVLLTLVAGAVTLAIGYLVAGR